MLSGPAEFGGRAGEEADAESRAGAKGESEGESDLGGGTTMVLLHGPQWWGFSPAGWRRRLCVQRGFCHPEKIWVLSPKGGQILLPSWESRLILWSGVKLMLSLGSRPGPHRDVKRLC